MCCQNVKTVGMRFRLVDARGQVVGRLAAQLATILQVCFDDTLAAAAYIHTRGCLWCRDTYHAAPQGKDKPSYSPHEDDGDIVVVINAEHVDFTGKKWDKKLYRWHTGCAERQPHVSLARWGASWTLTRLHCCSRFPGGLKQRTAKEQFAKDPSSILREAVLGMLPKNILRKACHPSMGRESPDSIRFMLPGTAPQALCCAGSGPKAADISVVRTPVSGSPAAHWLGG